VITVDQAINRINSGEDFWVPFGDFLDGFYRESTQNRRRIIMEEPVNANNVDRADQAMFAAAVHKLANDYSLEVPSWVWKQKYYMKDKPFFDCNAKGNLRLLFMYKSPTEFKHRNLFVDENILARV
jgi:hypothetical protein